MFIKKNDGSDSIVELGTGGGGEATYVKSTVTATQGQTTVTGLTYTAGLVDVYLNGAKLVVGQDVTATNGTSITVDGANQIQLGAAQDLKIFHNGGHSIIRETGTGSLYLQSDDNVILSTDSSTKKMVKGVGGGEVVDHSSDQPPHGSLPAFSPFFPE